MKNICVFCSASNGLDETYYTEARKMGELLAKNNYNLVYGGSSLGIMGEISKAVKENGSKIIGVIPEKLNEMCKHSDSNMYDEFYVTKGMRDRKAKMDELSDALVVLPGGFGTLEEVSEMIVQKILGYNNKPIVFLNTNHFYDNLFEFFEQIILEKFAQTRASYYYYLAQTPEEVIGYLQNYVPNELPKTLDDIYVRG